MTGWEFDHPLRAGLLFAAVTLVFVPSGAGLAWFCTWAGWVSTDNVIAGSLMGFGGVILGVACGFAAVRVASARYSRHGRPHDR